MKQKSPYARASEIRDRHFPGLEILRSSYTTTNPVYVIFDEKDEKSNGYCLKITRPGRAEREKKAMDFYREHRISLTLDLVLQGNDFLITLFDEDIEPTTPQDAASRLAGIHGNILEIKDRIPYEESTFRPVSRKAIWDNIKKSEFYIDHWFPTDRILELGDLLRHPCEKVPKILLHGDPHSRNITKDSLGRTKALDFELARIEHPSSDVAEAIICAGPKYLQGIIDAYIEDMPDMPGYDNEEKIKESILHDVLMRGAHSIARAQASFPDEEHTKRLGNKFKRLCEMIDC